MSEQFTKYALKLQLIGGNQDIKSSKVHVSLIKLRHMKEQLEMNRLERTKAIKHYNLSNCSVKIVDDALKIIGHQTVLLHNFKTNGDGTMNPKKIDRCKRVNDKTYEELKVIEAHMRANVQLSEIVQGIEVSKVISEKKIDEGGYSEIYKGEYIVNFYPTINPNLLKSSNNKAMEETASSNKMLVRKTLKSSQDNDLSFQN